MQNITDDCDTIKRTSYLKERVYTFAFDGNDSEETTTLRHTGFLNLLVPELFF